MSFLLQELCLQEGSAVSHQAEAFITVIGCLTAMIIHCTAVIDHFTTVIVNIFLYYVSAPTVVDTNNEVICYCIEVIGPHIIVDHCIFIVCCLLFM